MEPQDPQDKAYLISFTQCSIVRCQAKSRRPKGPKAGKPQESPPGGKPEDGTPS